MADINETIYLNRDNTITLELQEDGVATDLAAASRAILVLGSTTLDSDTVGWGSGQPFDASTGSGKLILELGAQTIPAGTYNARLIIYDSTHTNGLVWIDTLNDPALKVEVVSA